MTKSNHGRKGKVAALPLLALAFAGLPGAATAQQDGAPAPSPAPTPSPSPAPSPGPTIDFRLPSQNDGRTPGVQGPSDNGLPPLAPGEQRGIPTPAPTPAPQPTAPRIVPTQPAPAPAPSPSPSPTRRETPMSPPAPAPRAAPTDGAESDRSANTPIAAEPDSTAAEVPQASVDAASPPAGPDAPPAASPAPGEPPLWAWALALLAAAGAGLWYWRRRPALAGDVAEDAVETPPPPAGPAERAATPPPPAATPAAEAGQGQGPAPVPGAPRAASPLVTRPSAERRAQVAMALEIRAMRMTAEHLAVGFSLQLRNDGPLAATGLMVRIALAQGSAMLESVVARFFDGAGGSVLRDGIDLAPGATEVLSTEVTLPRRTVEPLSIGGKPMLVPVLVFDVTYHWDGDADAFGQTAATFVLGRAPAAGTGDRLAPLPLDRPAYAIDRPAARATAARRTL